MSIDLSYERTHRVLLVKFSGCMNLEDLNNLDTAVVAFVKTEGAPRAFMTDTTAVESFDVPSGEFARRGQSKSVVSNQDRVYVMPRDDMFGMGRMFSSYQRVTGQREPIVVKTLGEAFAALDIGDADFQPVASHRSTPAAAPQAASQAA